MYEVKVENPRWSMDSSGDMYLTVRVDRSCWQTVKKLVLEAVGKPYRLSLKLWREKRSRNANNLCWELCTRIAEAMGGTKEEVYRHSIREVGPYEPVPLRRDAVKRWFEGWESRGIGWFCEVVDDSKIPGYVTVFCYYGSSTYDTKEMSRLIDNLKQDAEAQGIYVDDREITSLLEEWGNQNQEKQSNGHTAAS